MQCGRLPQRVRERAEGGRGTTGRSSDCPLDRPTTPRGLSKKTRARATSFTIATTPLPRSRPRRMAWVSRRSRRPLAPRGRTRTRSGSSALRRECLDQVMVVNEAGSGTTEHDSKLDIGATAQSKSDGTRTSNGYTPVSCQWPARQQRRVGPTARPFRTRIDRSSPRRSAQRACLRECFCPLSLDPKQRQGENNDVEGLWILLDIEL
jgi:hypothetical protein